MQVLHTVWCSYNDQRIDTDLTVIYYWNNTHSVGKALESNVFTLTSLLGLNWLCRSLCVVMEKSVC